MAITTREMLVTPELATKWLNECNTHNRALRDSVVERYARDMKAGAWRLTHQGIAFDGSEADPKKTIVDGQHRLWAVITAEVPVRMMVSFGVSMDAQAVIDDNLQRTLVDTFKLAYGREDVTNMHVAIAKRLLGSTLRGKVTRQEVAATIKTHENAIAFAIGAFEKKVRGITTAPVMTVVARAYYTAPHVQLTRFVDALTTGDIDQDHGEQPILMLRNWLLEKAPLRGGSMTQAEAIYFKTERALRAFLDGERLTTLYAANGELFALPAEKMTRSKAVRKVPKRG
jgi:hypothetical protein